MKIKHFFLLIFYAAFAAIGCTRVDVPHGPLKVGDPMPDIFIPHLSNYSASSANFSDFRGKLVIFDFWNLFCHPCIAALPKLDSLQKQFAGRVQILLVNKVPQAEMDSLIQSRKRSRSINMNLDRMVKKLASITGDSVLNKLFPHTLIPHYVWISPDGKVAAVTEGSEITAENIKSALDRGDYPLAQKEDLRLDGSKSMLSQLYDADKANLKYYSSVMAFVPNLGGGTPDFVADSTENTMTISKSGSLLDLIDDIYRYAPFGNPHKNPNFEYGKRLVLETSDSSRFSYDYSTGISRDEWKSRNEFIYEAVFPLMSRDEAYAYFLQDIERYFQIDSRREKRIKECITIVRTSNTDKIAHDGGKIDLVISYDKDDTFHLYGGFMSTLRYKLSVVNKDTPYIFLDETGYTGRIQLELNAPLDNIDEVRKELREKYDLDLVKEIRDVDVVVLRDKRLGR